MKKRIFILIDEVEAFIKNHKVLRDSDDKLMANIWAKYIGNMEFLNAKDILTMLGKGHLPSYESISRCRRKLQEEFPELRGKKWKTRHENIKKDVEREVKEITSAIRKRKALTRGMTVKTPHPVGFEYAKERK